MTQTSHFSPSLFLEKYSAYVIYPSEFVYFPSVRSYSMIDMILDLL